LEVVSHALDKPFTESVYGIYVDAWGGVRYATDLLRTGVGLPDRLQRWARRSRGRR
jgi:hypothetical protein